MATVPVAPVVDLLDLRAIAGCGLEVARKPAGRRCLTRRCEEHQAKGGDGAGKKTGLFHSSISFVVRLGPAHLFAMLQCAVGSCGGPRSQRG